MPEMEELAFQPLALAAFRFRVHVARSVELYEMVALHFPNVPLPPLEQKRWNYARRRAS